MSIIEAILMSTNNTQFLNRVRNFPYIFVFWSYQKDFIETQNQVRIGNGKRAIGVRAIEVQL